MQNTFFIETWGCQMNDLDTQRLSGRLKLHGYRRVEDEQEAGLILLNTCSIREKAAHKVFTRLGQLRKLKDNGVTIGVCGCLAQQEGEAILARAPYVDFVIGPGNVGSIDEVLAGGRRVAVDFPDERAYDYLSLDRPSAVRAQVTVVEGCNKNCTFCIVPTTRGREMSRPVDQILGEVRHAINTGRVEIELLGQTVNAYRCPATGTDFPALLEQVAAVPGVRRLRFVTSHPAEVSRRMIEVMRDHPNICRYLHLPAQSGSSAVLRRMKRLYTRERYLALISEIRSEIPAMQFSTDLIVGFPGETEDDFQQTLSLVESVRFGSLFAFKYSERPGTPALKIGRAVDDQTGGERLQRVFSVAATIEEETLRGFVGRTVEILVEGPSRNQPDVMSGKSEHNWTVNFASPNPVPVGTFVNVRIDGAQHHSLRGEAVSPC